MYAAVFIRSVIGFQKAPQFGLIITLLLAWALVFIGSDLLARRYPLLSSALIGLEIVIILSLLLMTHSIRSDLFAFLFAITGMQVMQRHTPRVTAIVIGLSASLTFLSLFQLFGILQALALTMVYTALSIFLAAYVWATRQSKAIQKHQQALTSELQDANQKLDSYSHQAHQLAASRERQRLARELHDSVTQTIFSMTLAVQTARMSMRRDRRQVATQLDRLDYLTHSALAEMQTLISQLTPEDRDGGFIELLQQHLAERGRLENLSVKLDVEGDQVLNSVEQSSLYRIAQEALNNIVKHSRVNSAFMRLHQIDHYGWGR
jgi:signal transduction histidine kinase